MIVLHVPAVPGRAERAAVGARAAVNSPARASAAADRDTAAEKAVVGTVAAGSAAVDYIPAVPAGTVAGETCDAHRYLPTLEARPPPVLAVPDVGEEVAVAAAVEVRAVAGTLAGLAAHRTRVRVRAVAGSKPLLEITVQLPVVVT